VNKELLVNNMPEVTSESGRTAPREVLCSEDEPYCSPLGRCVSLFASNPCQQSVHSNVLPQGERRPARCMRT